MDAELFDNIQRDEAATDDDQAAINARLESHALDLHTHLPGIVESYDPAKQTAVVRPAIKTIFRNRGPVELPHLVDVPVHFPRGGGFVLTFPVAKGDECLLAFSERAIDFWWAKGGVQLPSEYRLHDLSDAFAFVGFSSVPSVPAGLSTTAVELRAVDNTAKISIDQGGNISALTDAGDITAQATVGKVVLNVPGGGSGAVQVVTGVLTGIDPCPILGMTHGALGGGCARVHAGKG